MPLTDQRIRALSKGNDVRRERTQLKAAIKARQQTVSAVLWEPTLPDYLVGMEVGKLLTALHGVSYKMACALCAELRIDALRRLGEMTYRQRRVIATHVKSRWEHGVRSQSAARARPRVEARGTVGQGIGGSFEGRLAS